LLNFKKILSDKPLSLGQYTESMAREHLEKQGLIFVAKNYRWRRGEIDLIMKDQQTLVFIEVRYRSTDHYGSSAESVTRHKQQKLIISAEHFLHTRHDLQKSICRFDVVAIYQAPAHTATLRINWIKNAFEAF
jgi:putative endonuclease